MKNKIKLKYLLIFYCGAFVYSYIIASLNNSHEVRTDLGAVLIIGFFSCLGFLFGNIYAYKKVANIPFGLSVLGALLIAPLLFYPIHFMINLFHDLTYLQRPDFNEVFWIYLFMLYFTANVFAMLIIIPLANKHQKKRELMDRLTGKNKLKN